MFRRGESVPGGHDLQSCRREVWIDIGTTGSRALPIWLEITFGSLGSGCQ